MSVLSASPQGRLTGPLSRSSNETWAGRRPSLWERVCRHWLRRRLQRLGSGRLEMVDATGCYDCGPAIETWRATIYIHHPRFYRRVLAGGSLAAAESYLAGDWDCDDLVTLMRILARDVDTLFGLERGAARLRRPIRGWRQARRQNSLRGSRRNIADHYDLSNDFFALMLDPSMTYSAGLFTTPTHSLQEASQAKYDRICAELRLRPGDCVLEIGCGWGGFAVHAARNYGCRVLTTTISQEQYRFVQRRVQEEAVGERVTVVARDYRDLSGQFDKIVSIEMIEAVGEQYLDAYFRQCGRLLKPGGEMLLQGILIPADRYDRYRRSVDFIQQYIFPGGLLPSWPALEQSVRRTTDFQCRSRHAFGKDYAETLRRWRHNFWKNIDHVRELGFDERFIRSWHYYLCYSEAAFDEGMIDVEHVHWRRPA